MSLFTWKPEYALAVSEIDSQHRKLFETADRLVTAMSEGQAREAQGRILQDLILYTVTHFAAEERLMQRHAYPAYTAHKAEHDKLTAQVQRFLKDHQAGRVALSVDMLRFLKDWLAHHILEIDLMVARHLRRRVA